MRPWLDHYPDWLPHEIAAEYASICAMFDAVARRTPDAIAIYDGDRAICYRDLAGASARLAAQLAGAGVAGGDRVAVFMQSVAAFPLAALAIWRLGAILVPVNPMLVDRELRHVLDDSGAVAIIYGDELSDLVGRTNIRIALAASTLPFDGPDVAFVDRPVGPSDIACLTYTSGTTGPSKGAMNTHGNAVFNATLYREWMSLTGDDVIIGLAPLFHITGLVGHILAAWSAGAPLVLIGRFDAAEAVRRIEQHRGTFTIASITAFIALLEAPNFTGADLSSLRKVFSGGAPIAPATVERFRAATGAYIHNLYGLTETTSPSHAVPMGMRAPIDRETGVLSVGLPVCNVDAAVIDPETGRRLPAGEVGELVIRGPMVVPGYWRLPDESARAIRDGWLHTGDIGKLDASGWFYIIDRSKDMIIASGFKVWPREVEDLLYTHPAVREACVVGVPDAYRGETVKAFVSLRPSHPRPIEHELIQFCRDRMAAYKYPRSIEILDELPKTATGKLLRRTLRGPHA